MLGLILTIAIIGLIVWAIITYLPMPAPFQGIIVIIAVLVVAFAVFGGGNLGGIGCGTGSGLNLRHF